MCPSHLLSSWRARPPCISVSWHRRLCFSRPPPRALGVRPSQPHVPVAPGAISLWPWGCLCQPVSGGSRRRRGSCSLTDGPCLLWAARGHVPLKGRMFGCRLAHPDQAGSGHTSVCCFWASLQWSSETGWAHCCDLCSCAAFSHFMSSASILRKHHYCFPCHLCSLSFFSSSNAFVCCNFGCIFSPACLRFLPAAHYEDSPSHLIILVAKLSLFP